MLTGTDAIQSHNPKKGGKTATISVLLEKSQLGPTQSNPNIFINAILFIEKTEEKSID